MRKGLLGFIIAGVLLFACGSVFAEVCYVSVVDAGCPSIPSQLTDTDCDGYIDHYWWLYSCINKEGDTSSTCYNPDQSCTNCGGDSDGDLICQHDDNCPTAANQDQKDCDYDGVGDKCDADSLCGDIDGDGVLKAQDNCPDKYNPAQGDHDGDGIGDVCDNCRYVYNLNQNDSDLDSIGDVCDYANKMPSGTTNDLYSVWGSSADNVFAVGSSGTILHYDGNNWASVTSGTTNDLYSVWVSSSNHVFIGSRSSKNILHYHESIWTVVSFPDLIGFDLLWEKGICSIWGNSESDFFAVNNAYIYISAVDHYGDAGVVARYNGSTWSSKRNYYGGWMSGATLNFVQGRSTTDVFVVGTGGAILHYDGSAWSSMVSGTSNSLLSVWAGDLVFAVGSNGTILHYNGSSWYSLESGAGNTLHGVWGSSGHNVFIVGTQGIIFHLNLTDLDLDRISDAYDNCPSVYNPDQKDCDGDGVGDKCETDSDTDVIPNDCDNCPTAANQDQKDCDYDGVGDKCDADSLCGDIDGDGVLKAQDNCPTVSNPYQEDRDGNGVGDACNNAEDSDGDDWANSLDNCPDKYNPAQGDHDGDGIGNICEAGPPCYVNIGVGSNSKEVTDTNCNGIADTDEVPTLIKLSSFTATPQSGNVILNWSTSSEIDNAGFNLYRSEAENGEYTKINDALIPAEGSPTQGASYTFTDDGLQNRKTYWYKLEDIDMNGNATMHGIVSATPRLIFGSGK